LIDVLASLPEQFLLQGENEKHENKIKERRMIGMDADHSFFIKVALLVLVFVWLVFHLAAVAFSSTVQCPPLVTSSSAALPSPGRLARI
jgi:hypothetical protein